MKIAVIGSRNVEVTNLAEYLPQECDEIVSGGARGVDLCASQYARERGLKLTEFLPQYDVYGRVAPIVRNKEIVRYADEVIAFWDGTSKGTLFVINYCKKLGKPCRVVLMDATPFS